MSITLVTGRRIFPKSLLQLKPKGLPKRYTKDKEVGLHPPPGLADFCESNKARLVGVLTLQCSDPHVAEELAQDTLAKVCVKWDSVKKMANPEAWMFRVGINLANSYFRRRAAEHRAGERLVADATHRETDPSDVIAIREGLQALPRRQRAVLVLRYYADLSVRQVGEALDMPEGTVKTLTARGLSGGQVPLLRAHPRVDGGPCCRRRGYRQDGCVFTLRRQVVPTDPARVGRTVDGSPVEPFAGSRRRRGDPLGWGD
ncbi:MAG: RNA polymerase sigma factor [Actinomycetota bacterium]